MKRIASLLVVCLILTATIITNFDEIYVVDGRIVYGEICTEDKIKFKASGAIVVDGLTHNIHYTTRLYNGTCSQFYSQLELGGGR